MERGEDRNMETDKDGRKRPWPSRDWRRVIMSVKLLGKNMDNYKFHRPPSSGPHTLQDGARKGGGKLRKKTA